MIIYVRPTQKMYAIGCVSHVHMSEGIYNINRWDNLLKCGMITESFVIMPTLFRKVLVISRCSQLV
jgi:hypothetical protein